MQLPIQITFRDLPHSDAIEQDIRAKASKLERHYNRIMGCRVVIEPAHRHHHRGNLYRVRVDVTVPNGELVASRERDQHQAHEDAHVAIRDAFHAVERQLQRYADERRGDIKTHAASPQGSIARLVPAENYGVITSTEGREIYFHRNSVVNANFDSLAPGAIVRFAEERGENGPQASFVELTGNHRDVTH